MLPSSSYFNRRAALLLEVLVALSLILLSSVAFYGLLANARLAEARASQILVANSLARGLMENYTARGYESLKPGSEKGARTYGTLREGIAGQIELSYTVTVSGSLAPDVWDIVVEVDYGAGRVNLESYVVK